MEHNSFPLIGSYNNKVLKFENRQLAKATVAPLWKKVIKRLLDITAAVLGLTVLSPVMIYVAIKIKLDSAGPIFYLQERIGINGRSFTIFKFRSMVENAEQDGPALSSSNDKRVTRWGETIRRWKLDELPQLLNILVGDMSLVGPRPERKFYIDKIAANYPYFKYLHQVKPGLTSLGMIKFGYAQNLEQILQRINYDITYIESYSLLLDFKIIYYTLRSIIDGKIFDPRINLRIRLTNRKISTLN